MELHGDTGEDQWTLQTAHVGQSSAAQLVNDIRPGTPEICKGGTAGGWRPVLESGEH